MLGLIAVGAVGWFLYQDFSGRAGSDASIGEGAGPGAPPSQPSGMPGAPSGTDVRSPRPEARAPNRTDRILTCKAPDGSTFYTNARSCDEADLDNRVNVMPAEQPGDEALSADARRQAALDEARACLARRLRGEREVRLLPVCNEPFRQALDLERFLARADDPVDSSRAGEYCDLIAQGVHAGCPATSEIFCYLRICQQRVER
jgi:hypothetical protein